MIRGSTILTIVTLFAALQVPANADEPVRIRNDGGIVDINGNIIAVPNPGDKKNNEYNTYYSKIDANGKTSGKSDFYIYYDKNAGIMKKDLTEEPKTDVGMGDLKIDNPQPQQQAINPGNSSQTLEKAADGSVYNNMSGGSGSSVYGN